MFVGVLNRPNRILDGLPGIQIGAPVNWDDLSEEERARRVRRGEQRPDRVVPPAKEEWTDGETGSERGSSTWSEEEEGEAEGVREADAVSSAKSGGEEELVGDGHGEAPAQSESEEEEELPPAVAQRRWGGLSDRLTVAEGVRIDPSMLGVLHGFVEAALAGNRAALWDLLSPYLQRNYDGEAPGGQGGGDWALRKNGWEWGRLRGSLVAVELLAFDGHMSRMQTTFKVRLRRA